MLRRAVFFLFRLSYKLYIKDIASDCMLHEGGRAIHGSYIHMKRQIELGKGWLLAVYPEHGGKKNPVVNGGGIFLGNHVTANRELTIYCAEKVTIEDNVMMGSHILITDNDHGTRPDQGEYWEQPLVSKPVIIHNGCWICERAFILAGSEIGEKSIVAAGSVVKGYYPPYSMIAGAPARVVRRWNPESGCWEKP